MAQPYNTPTNNNNPNINTVTYTDPNNPVGRPDGNIPSVPDNRSGTSGIPGLDSNGVTYRYLYGNQVVGSTSSAARAYNPFGYNNSNQRYQAWVDAGRPFKDRYGNQLDTTGTPIVYGFNDQAYNRGDHTATPTSVTLPNGQVINNPSIGPVNYNLPGQGVNTTPPPGVTPPPSGTPPPPAGNNNTLLYANSATPVTPPPAGTNTGNPSIPGGSSYSPNGGNTTLTTGQNPNGNINVIGRGKNLPIGGTTTLTDGAPPPVGTPPTGAPPPVTPPPQNTGTNNNLINGGAGMPDWVLNLLGGNSPVGSSGVNIQNSLAQFVSGQTNGQVDPRLLRYGHFETVGSESTHPNFVPNNPRINEAGFIDGHFAQLGSDNGGVAWNRVIDPSQVHYDPEFGLITPSTNLRNPEGRGDDLFFTIAGGMIAAPAITAALGGVGTGAATAATAGTEGGYTAGTVGGITYPPLLEGVTAPTIPSLAAAPTFGGASTLGGLYSNYIRPGLSILGGANTLNNLINGGGGGGSRPAGSPGLLDGLLPGVVNNVTTNHNINSFQDWVNQMMNRGDYNAPYRDAYLQQLSQIMQNPDLALNSPGYRKARQSRQDAIAAEYNARGMGLSGNEILGTADELSQMDYTQINQIENNLMKAAGLGDPSGMARAGIQAGGLVFGARNQRDATIGALLGRSGSQILSSIFNGKSIADWIRSLQSGDITWQDAPQEVRDILQQGADNYGGSVDRFVQSLIDNTWTPDINIDYGDGDNFWENLFNNGSQGP